MAYTRSTALSGAGTTVLAGSAILNSSATAADITVTFADDTRVGINGSTTASSWIKDMLAGTDSLDIVMIGDSNTQYGTVAGGVGWGFMAGYTQALKDMGGTFYGTMIHPVAKVASVQKIGYYTNSERCPPGASSGAGSSGTAAFGSVAAPAGLQALFPGLSSGLTPEGEGATDFLYINGATGTTYGFTNGIVGMYINDNNALGNTNELRYRVLRSAMPASDTPGSFSLFMLRGGSGNIYTGRIGTTSSSYGFQATELISTANAATTTISVHPFFYSGNAATSEGVRDNVGFALQSIYRPVKGFSVGCLNYLGGATMTDIVADIEGPTDLQLSTILKETYDRQVSAGGTGRVAIWIQGGTNIPTSVDLFTDAVRRIKNKIERSWAVAGLPSSKLTFVANVSHQKDLADLSASNQTDLGPIRTAARTMVSGANPETNLTIVTLNSIASYYDLVPLYDPLGSIHLTNSGFNTLGRKVMDAMVGSIDVSVRLLPGQVVPVAVSSVTLTAGQSCVVLS
jgi:hypothetical protein